MEGNDEDKFDYNPYLEEFRTANKNKLEPEFTINPKSHIKIVYDES